MWEVEPKVIKKKETQFLTEWMQSVMNSSLSSKAELVLADAEKASDLLRAYRVAPQSAPWHTEGLFVSENIVRTLAGFFAIVEGKRLSEIEEFSARKELQLEVLDLERTIRSQSQLLEVFILVHDIAKPATLSFDAPQNSLGAKEGFMQSHRRSSPEATEVEKQIYIKLAKAFSAGHPLLSREEVTAGFYDKFEVRTHYDKHERVALQGEHLQGVEQISDFYELSDEQKKLLKFLITNHMTAVRFGRDANRTSSYELLVARAHKLGLDADLAIDVLFAAMFLDGSVGSLHYEHGNFSTEMSSVFAFMKAEEDVAGHRKESRRKKSSEEDSRALRAVLKEAGLDGDTVFGLLKTPFGSERGRIMGKIKAYVQDLSLEVEFSSHQTELSRRIDEARSLLTS